MVLDTRLNGTQFFLNAELIKMVEATPDTVITLTDGGKLIVRESPADVTRAIVAYRRAVYADRPAHSGEIA